MAITSITQLVAASNAAERIRICKPASVADTAGERKTTFAMAGTPPAGVLNPGNTNGIIPIAGQLGYPAITGFPVGATGYITRVEATYPGTAQVALYDVLWRGGYYAGATDTALTPPALVRVPDGDYKNCQFFLESAETNLLITGNINYLDGTTTGQTTSFSMTPTLNNTGAWYPLPLVNSQGIRAVTNVTRTDIMTGVNIVLVIARKLWGGPVRYTSDTIVHGLDSLGLTRVYDTSALVMVNTRQTQVTGQPIEMCVDIAPEQS